MSEGKIGELIPIEQGEVLKLRELKVRMKAVLARSLSLYKDLNEVTEKKRWELGHAEEETAPPNAELRELLSADIDRLKKIELELDDRILEQMEKLDELQKKIDEMEQRVESVKSNQ